MMKKCFYTLLILIICSCSASDDSITQTSDEVISPPDWIIGTWLTEIDGETFNNGFKFTPDDMIQILSISSELSYKGIVKQGMGEIKVSQTINSNEYTIEINSSGVVNRFSFTNGSTNNTIVYLGGKLYKQ